MSDLILNKEGDLKAIKRSNNNLLNNITNIDGIYDLEITNNYKKDLILKAIKTPKNKITIFILNELDILLQDNEYGSDIYKELSEGITLNVLSRIKSHIIQSLKNANLINNINQVNIGVINSTTIQLKISYTDQTIADNIQLNI